MSNFDCFAVFLDGILRSFRKVNGTKRNVFLNGRNTDLVLPYDPSIYLSPISLVLDFSSPDAFLVLLSFFLQQHLEDKNLSRLLLEAEAAVYLSREDPKRTDSNSL